MKREDINSFAQLVKIEELKKLYEKIDETDSFLLSNVQIWTVSQFIKRYKFKKKIYRFDLFI